MTRAINFGTLLLLTVIVIPVSCDEKSAQPKDTNPILSITPTTIDFGSDQTVMRFTIANLGSGDLNWNVSEALDWLTILPGAGVTTTETDTVMVYVDRPGLSSDTLNGTVTVSSNGGQGGVQVTAVDTSLASAGIYGEFFVIRRLIPHRQMGIMRRDRLEARFDSSYTPCLQEMPLQVDSVGCNEFSLGWNDTSMIYEYSQTMHSAFLEIGASYEFDVTGNIYVPSLIDSVAFPMYEPYLTGPVDGDSISRSSGLILSWENFGEGTVFIALASAADSSCIMPGNLAGIEGLFIETENDGEYSIPGAELGGLAAGEYVLEIDLYHVHQIETEGYDPRSFMMGRTISRITLYLE